MPKPGTLHICDSNHNDEGVERDNCFMIQWEVSWNKDQLTYGYDNNLKQPMNGVTIWSGWTETVLHIFYLDSTARSCVTCVL